MVALEILGASLAALGLKKEGGSSDLSRGKKYGNYSPELHQSHGSHCYRGRNWGMRGDRREPDANQ
jgi:hypothetical protein